MGANQVKACVVSAGALSEEDLHLNTWRTAPLWGIGLTQKVNPHATVLPDGRARNLEEAILWHGGEAETSRVAYQALPQSQRQALLQWLRQP